MCGITILWGTAVTEEMHDASIRALQEGEGRGPNITHQDFLFVESIPVAIGLTYQHSRDRDILYANVQRCNDGRIIVHNGVNMSVIVDVSAHTITGMCSPSCAQPLFFVEGDAWCGFVSDRHAIPAGVVRIQPVEPGGSHTLNLTRK
jgi:hypothetical protein